MAGGAVIEKFSWSPEPANGKFAAGTEYTLSVTIRAAENTALSEYLTATVNGSAANVTSDGNTAIVTYTFPKTAGGSSGGSHHTSSSSTARETLPSVNGASKNWADIAAEISKLAENSSITIKLNGSYNVPVEVIKAIADRNIRATFVVDSWRSWYLDGADIEIPAAADLTILQLGYLDSSTLRGTAGAKLHINGTNNPTSLIVSFKKDYAGTFANLFRRNDDKPVFAGIARVDTDGRVMISAKDSGDYVIILGEYSDLPGDMDNNGMLTATDALEVLRYVVSLTSSGNLSASDIDGDGAVTALDASVILRRSFSLR